LNQLHQEYLLAIRDLLLLFLACFYQPIAIWMGISQYSDALIDTITQLKA